MTKSVLSLQGDQDLKKADSTKPLKKITPKRGEGWHVVNDPTAAQIEAQGGGKSGLNNLLQELRAKGVDV